MTSTLVHVSLPAGVGKPCIQVQAIEDVRGCACTWNSTVMLGCPNDAPAVCLFEWGSWAADTRPVTRLADQLECTLGATAFTEILYTYTPAHSGDGPESHDTGSRGLLHTTVAATRKRMSILLPCKVSKISTGGLGHAILIDDTGCAWTFGENRYFQCGLTGTVHARPSRPQVSAPPRGHNYIESPTMLPMFGPQAANGGVIEAACGWNHSALVTTQFQLFTFGLNNFGQCGVESTLMHDSPAVSVAGIKRPRSAVQLDMSQSACVFEPTRVDDFDGVAAASGKSWVTDPSSAQVGCVQMVTCGAWHTVALTQSGDVYTVGQGSFGQLGHEYPVSDDAEALSRTDKGTVLLALGTTALFRGAETSFRQVKLPRDDVIRKVAAAPKCTFCVSESGTLYGMGYGANLRSPVSSTPVHIAISDLSDSLSAFRKCVNVWVGRSHLVLHVSAAAENTTSATSSQARHSAEGDAALVGCTAAAR
jgi:alpha-tubulin suppressor-like RCC1 family protein